jgi:hypothetical protein
MQGVTFEPKFESGHFFTALGDPDDPNKPAGGEMVPLVYTMNMVFEPLHESAMGFDTNGVFLNKGFPYNMVSGSAVNRVSGADPMEG